LNVCVYMYVLSYLNKRWTIKIQQLKGTFNLPLGLTRVNVHSYAPPTKGNNNKSSKRQSINRLFSLPAHSPPHSAITVIGSTVGSLALTQINWGQWDHCISSASAIRVHKMSINRACRLLMHAKIVCNIIKNCWCIEVSLV